MILHVGASAADLVRSFLVAETTADRDGFLQGLRPRAKLVGVAALVGGAVVSRHPVAVAAFGLAPVALAVASAVSLRRLAARSAPVVLFSVVAVAPQALLQPGPALVEAAGLSLTRPGVTYVLTFLVRVWAGVSLLGLVVLTTPLTAVVAALRGLRVPATAVWLTVLTARYLFVLVAELQGLLRARRARSAGDRNLRTAWRHLAGLSGTFFVRTIERGERVHRAVRARGGARGPSPYDRPGSPGRADYLFVGAALVAAVAAGVIRWLP